MRNKIQGFTKFAGGKLVAGAVLAGEKTREGIAVAKRKAKMLRQRSAWMAICS